jgi:hypothetical protein
MVRRPDLLEAMRALVLPFVRAARERHSEPDDASPDDASSDDLEVYDYATDGITMVPAGSRSTRVIEILLSPELIDRTRKNVRVRFDDVNDGTTTIPPVDYDNRGELQGWTLRALEEWAEYVAKLLSGRDNPMDAFARVYVDFEARFFSDSYLWMWISPLANFTFHGARIDLENGLTIRYLQPVEQDLRHQGFDHYRSGGPRQTAPPRIALVQTTAVDKGGRIDFGEARPPLTAASIVIFCIRALRPGGVYCDELNQVKNTCWGLDSGASTFWAARQITSERGYTHLDEHASANLTTLWEHARARDDFNTRFLATKLQDNAERDSLLDRFVDAAIALQNIYGSEGARFASAMAWALRGHRDAAERQAVWELGREITRRRNGILHGNKELIRPLFDDPAKFQDLTDRAEQFMRQSLQLLLLNTSFREQLDKATLGADVNFKRLPFSF